MLARNGGRYPPLAVFEETLSAQASQVSLVRGHYPFAAHALLANPITITVLRDPVQRTISALKHWVAHEVIAHDVLMESLDAGVLPPGSNDLVRYLSAGPHEELVAWDERRERGDLQSEPTEADLDAALKTLERVDVLGVIEDMPAFATRLKSATGVDLPAMQKVNVSSVRLALSDGHMEVIRRRNQLDTQLYRRALQLLATRIP